VPGVRPADVVIVGGGVVGVNAAQMALGLGAHVVIFDVNLDRLRYLDQVLSGRLTTLSANPLTSPRPCATPTCWWGGAHQGGAGAQAGDTPDGQHHEAGQRHCGRGGGPGGCIETTHATTHSHPTFVVDESYPLLRGQHAGGRAATSTYA